MTTAHIILTDAESEAIKALGQQQGKTPEEVLREAVEHFLSQNHAQTRLTSLRQARGIWQKRDDLPDFAQLRKEWDR